MSKLTKAQWKWIALLSHPATRSSARKNSFIVTNPKLAATAIMSGRMFCDLRDIDLLEFTANGPDVLCLTEAGRQLAQERFGKQQ